MNKSVHEAKTVEAKHIFIDIVEYTHNRSVEAQSDLIETLNRIVKETINELTNEDDKIIYSSTGDGMCISLINVIDPYDIHMQIALLLLGKKEIHNKNEKQKMRRFDLRIGINENTDNLILDINDQEGISGAGINEASRIEGLCDKNQILVGKSVHNKLEQREVYMTFFVEHFAIVKHGKKLPVYQYIDQSKSYLNNQTPTQFAKNKNIELNIKKIKISELQAFYMINCIINKTFLLKRIKDIMATYSLIIVILHKAEDEIKKSKQNEMTTDVYLKVSESHEEYYQKIGKTPHWVIMDFANLIREKKLVNIQSYFNGDNYFFINEQGKKALIIEYPELCKEHGIEL